MKRILIITAMGGLLIACNAKVGDECTYDVDCSANMDRNCDNGQPSGYCLVIGCGPDECPSEASCVSFTTPCPTGEGYDESTAADTADAAAQSIPDAGSGDGGGALVPEYDKCRLIEPNRGRTYCLKHCRTNKDCRGKYVCAEVSKLSAAVIDFKGDRTKVCVPRSNVP